MSPARATLRYRPLGDVLVAEIPMAGSSVVRHESLDADVTLRWSRLGSGAEVLTGVHVVRASQNTPRAALSTVLPSPLADEIAALVRRGERAVAATDSLASRARSVVESSFDIPHDSLCRRSVPVRSGPVRGSGRLVRSLRALSRSLRDALEISTGSDRAATERLATGVDELATVLRAGRPAPGEAAALRGRVRGRIPLTAAERVELRRLLDLLADPTAWGAVADGVASIAVSIAPWRPRP